MRNAIATICLGMLSFSMFGQAIDDHDGKELLVKCHTYEMHDKLLEDHPELEQSIAESVIAQDAHRRAFETSGLAKDGDEYTIPVVFHIIHNFGEENISPEQVRDCIRVLNEDFSAQNPGIAGVNAAFTDIVANVGVKFALAQRDPDGNCTNGIVRSVDALTNEGGENLKEISPIWDRSMYMNVWVCKTIASGAAGYTRYPSSVNNAWGDVSDGIVVRHDYVGAIGTASPTRSHTLTHEVGHWIDLPHVWGSTNEPAIESNCFSDDGIDDTPLTIGWESCNTNGESCGSLDNVQNYMEYSYCSKMFTLGQAARMHAALNSTISSRVNLWQPENLIATGVDLEPEICKAEMNVDRRVVCVGDSVLFSDYSYNGATSRTWSFDGGLPLTSNSIDQYVTYNAPGTYNVGLIASDGNNEVEITETEYILVLDTALTAIPFVEGFEDITEFSDANSIWGTDNQDTPNVDWEVTDAAAYSGNHSAFVHGRINPVGATEYLLSQTFDMTEVTDYASLTFKYACAKRNTFSDDQLRVWISRNCGDHWSLRKTIDDDELYSVPNNVTGEFVPDNQSQWNEITIDNIVSVFATSSFRIRFEFISNNGNNVYIDDINLVNESVVTTTREYSEFKNGVRIFPNPASNIVNLQLEGAENIEQLEISLLDISGRLIQKVYNGQTNLSAQKMEIDVSNLPNGLYFVEFAMQGARFAEKIVVRD